MRFGAGFAIISRMVKIALGDLRHRTAGKQSIFIPIGIGYIAAYALDRLGPDAVDIRLYSDPNAILDDIDSWKPDVVGLANYCWNSELSRLVFRYAKERIPRILCVAGGPDFPTDQKKCRAHLLERPEIDLYVYLEGETAFTDLVEKLNKGMTPRDLKSNPQGGTMSIDPASNSLVTGEPLPRIMDMDGMPSPYLTGLFDTWFDGSYAPAIQTSRGCPFTCAFCFMAKERFARLAAFSMERVTRELTYIAERMKDHPHNVLAICDSNFGMYERDEEIALHMRKLQDEYGWPNAFDVSTGKQNYDRILRIMDILQHKMYITCSVQSLNPETLRVIRRKNTTMDVFTMLSREIKKRGMKTTTELIYPMPKETKKSFLDAIKDVMDSIKADLILPYTAMLLKGTYLESEECRDKFGMKTRFRVVPRQFGEYRGRKAFEIEEVCIATDTLTFEDYMEIRKFSLVFSFFSTRQFDIIHKHLEELGISKYDYSYYLWSLIASGDTPLSDVYNRFAREAENELWDSPDAIYDFFNDKENYSKLLYGQLGDNLIRKYVTEFVLECCAPSIELAYAAVKKLAREAMTDKRERSLDAAKRWMAATRSVDRVLKDDSYLDLSETLNLSHDVAGWYRGDASAGPLTAHERDTDYRLSCDSADLRELFSKAKDLYGGDLFFRTGKLWGYFGLQKFWRRCETIK